MEFPSNILATSKEVKGLMADLLDIQKNITTIKKSETNKHFGSKYANYAAVWETCGPLLNEKGILVIHSPGQDGDFVIMDTIFLKVDGDEWLRIRSSAKPVDLKPQTIGLVHTYLKRYNVGHGLNLVFEDDDGNAGSGIAPPPTDLLPKPTAKTMTKATRGVDAIKQIDPVASGDTADTLIEQINGIMTKEKLDQWKADNKSIVDNLPPKLRTNVLGEYVRRNDEFKEIAEREHAA